MLDTRAIGNIVTCCLLYNVGGNWRYRVQISVLLPTTLPAGA